MEKYQLGARINPARFTALTEFLTEFAGHGAVFREGREVFFETKHSLLVFPEAQYLGIFTRT